MEETKERKKRKKRTGRKQAGNSGRNVIAYQNKDITSKVLAEQLKGKSFRVYGLDMPEVKAVQPTNIPTVKVNELRIDNLFELMDGTVAIVDYESEYKKADKVKYLNYLTGIADRYLKEKRDCPVLRMVVIYTGDIKRRQVSAEYNIGAVRMKLEPAFLSELDSEGIFLHLKRKVERHELLDDEELMKFIILPLSYRTKDEKKEKIREVVELAVRIQDISQQIFVLSGILAFTDKLIDEKTANQIRKVIGMTKVAMIFEKEKQEAVAKAERELQGAVARAEAEMQRAKREKQEAVAKAERDLQRAVARAEKEKQEAEEKRRQEARESVTKMIQKGYSSKEIAFIISSFSMDEIEAVRKEITRA